MVYDFLTVKHILIRFNFSKQCVHFKHILGTLSFGLGL